MNEAFVVIANILYLAGACLALKYFNLPFLRFNTWSYTWAGLFIASIFLIIGLFLFDIPFLLSSTDSEGIQRAKDEWWMYPFFPFLALAFTLCLRVILSYVRGNLDKRRSKFYLFLASCSITTCLMVLFIMSWLRDPELATPGTSEYILFVILWLLGVGFFTFGAVASKAVLKSKKRK